jgi:hypothetical protein
MLTMPYIRIERVRLPNQILVVGLGARIGATPGTTTVAVGTLPHRC